MELSGASGVGVEMRTCIRTPLAPSPEATMGSVAAGSRLLAILVALALLLGVRPAVSSAPVASGASATVTATATATVGASSWGASQPALHSFATCRLPVQPRSGSVSRHGATLSATSFDEAPIIAASDVVSGDKAQQPGNASAGHGYDATAPPALS